MSLLAGEDSDDDDVRRHSPVGVMPADVDDSPTAGVGPRTSPARVTDDDADDDETVGIAEVLGTASGDGGGCGIGSAGAGTSRLACMHAAATATDAPTTTTADDGNDEDADGNDHDHDHDEAQAIGTAVHGNAGHGSTKHVMGSTKHAGHGRHDPPIHAGHGGGPATNGCPETSHGLDWEIGAERPLGPAGGFACRTAVLCLALDPTDPGSIVTSDGTTIQWWARGGSARGGSAPAGAGAVRGGGDGTRTGVGDGEATR